MNPPERSPEPPERLPRPPQPAWHEKPRGRLAPEELDDLDRRLGRDRRRPRFFL